MNKLVGDVTRQVEKVGKENVVIGCGNLVTASASIAVPQTHDFRVALKLKVDERLNAPGEAHNVALPLEQPNLLKVETI